LIIQIEIISLTESQFDHVFIGNNDLNTTPFIYESLQMIRKEVLVTK